MNSDSMGLSTQYLDQQEEEIIECLKKVNSINDIKKWHIYNFKREWLGETQLSNLNKGKWRPCIVLNINRKSIHLLPLSSKPSKEEFTIKFDSKIRRKPSYICVDFIKILDPSKIIEEEICNEVFNIRTNKQLKITSKVLKKQIKDTLRKYTESFISIVI